MDTVDNAITKPARRLEVFTGAGRRWTWSDKDKARVVAEIETSRQLGFRRGAATRIVATAIVWLAAANQGGSGGHFQRQRSAVCAGRHRPVARDICSARTASHDEPPSFAL